MIAHIGFVVCEMLRWLRWLVGFVCVNSRWVRGGRSCGGWGPVWYYEDGRWFFGLAICLGVGNPLVLEGTLKYINIFNFVPGHRVQRSIPQVDGVWGPFFNINSIFLLHWLIIIVPTVSPDYLYCPS